MTCASCAVRVERVLGRQPGVEAAAVNFAGGSARIPSCTACGAVTICKVEVAYGSVPVGRTMRDGSLASTRSNKISRFAYF